MAWPGRAPRAVSSWQVGRPETLRWPGLDSCRPRGLWRAVPAQGRLGKAWGGADELAGQGSLPVSVPPDPRERVDTLQHPPLKLSTLPEASRECGQVPPARIPQMGQGGQRRLLLEGSDALGASMSTVEANTPLSASLGPVPASLRGWLMSHSQTLSTSLNSCRSYRPGFGPGRAL